MVKVILVVALIVRAIYTDMKKGTIGNVLIVLGLMSGLICAYVEKGMNGLFRSMGMALLMLAGLFFLFCLKGLGGGDIKLLCVLATFYPDSIITVVIASFVAGAGIGIVRMVVRFFRGMQVWIRGETLHFSIPIGIGVIYMLMQGG